MMRTRLFEVKREVKQINKEAADEKCARLLDGRS
jgi:hypothetical protein